MAYTKQCAFSFLESGRRTMHFLKMKMYRPKFNLIFMEIYGKINVYLTNENVFFERNEPDKH
jgi:hypothetical protein